MMSKKKVNNRILGWYFNSNLLWRILIALILGVIVGVLAGKHILWVEPFGDLFIRLLQMIVMPIIISTLIIGAASVSPANLGKSGIKIVLFYLITTAFALIIGLIAANIFHPGASLDLGNTANAAGKSLNQPSLVETFLNIVPTNIFSSLSEGNVLPTIFFSILFGIGLSYLRASEDERLVTIGDTLYRFFDGIAEITFIIVRWIMEYAPIGVFALIAVVFAKQEASVIGSLGIVLLAVYLGLFVHLIVVYGGILKLNNLSFLTFLKGAREAMVTAFVTRSSGGTLPVTMRCSDTLGIDRSISSLTLPLGATINMDGTALYQGVCALFVGFAVGLPLDFGQQVTVVITAVLASIGTAGVPGAGAIMLLIVLKSIGLDIEEGSAVAAAYAMILGIDALLDMGRTALNITGDLTGTTIVAKSEDQLAKIPLAQKTKFPAEV
jgi:Na+/H+-dicarboxylate symporter